MFRIAICEDNPKEAEKILSLLTRFQTTRPGIDFYTQYFDSGVKLLENIKTEQTYDLFLLDVLMPDITGIELARKLRKENFSVPVIFLTSSVDYALPAYKVSAVQYILKPIAEEELFSVLDQILASRKQKKDKFFVLFTQERILKIAFSSIVYIEITGHIMRVCLDNGDTLLSKSIKVPFQNAIAPLLDDNRFMSAHKSYLINMEHVQELSGKTFVMTGGYIIPIPKYRVANAKEKYFGYLSQSGIGRLGSVK